VVRYFGGTLLGVPGLINAYKTVSSLVLQVVPLVQKAVTKKLALHFDYTQMNDIMLILKQLQVDIVRQETQLFCVLEVSVPLNRKEELEYRLKNLRNVEVSELL
jgi:putative IMPACT (imprinted ancient) family translation regulator